MRARSLSWPSGVLAALAFAALVGCGSEQEAPPSRPVSPPADEAAHKSRPADVPQPAPAADPAPAQPVPRGYAGPLPPLPNVPYPPARSMDVTQAAYAFAARNPDVLHYVPCFCGCEHHGHQGNDQCFVSGRDADGKPRWEMHGYV